MPSDEPHDTPPSPREDALRAELAVIAIEAQGLQDRVTRLFLCRQIRQDELAALIAPYPVGTVVEESYLRGTGRERRRDVRRWRLRKAIFRYSMTMEHLAYDAVFIKKDGTPGVACQRIAATTLLAGRFSSGSTTTWRVIEVEGA